MMRRRRVNGEGDGPVGPQRTSVWRFCRVYAFPAPFSVTVKLIFWIRRPWNHLKAWRHSLVSIYIGMWPCNVAFVCQKIFECNDDCLYRESKANGFGSQSFVSWVELIIFDGLLFVDSCQSLMMGATSMFNRKDGHGCHILLPLHPGR